MSELLAAAAAALGAPEVLVARSAAARASATGVTVDEILAAWAGGAAAPPAVAPTAPRPMEMAEVEEVAVVAPVIAPIAEPVAAAAVPLAAAPVPERVGVAEAARYPVVVTVPTVGLKERTTVTMPMWLVAAFLILPSFGLLRMAGDTQGIPCGEAGQLRVDRVSGAVINCDGTEFSGRPPPGAGDVVGTGGALFAGQVVSKANCSGCHGADGQGQGKFPALNGGSVVKTFSNCQDHIQWVTVGSRNWGKPTYGDLAKPVGGSGSNMPSFQGILTDEQIQTVVAYERIVHGGLALDEVLVDCGFVEAETTGSTVPGETGTTVAGETAAGSSTTSTTAL